MTHSELLKVQHYLLPTHQLSYFDFMGHSRLTVRLTHVIPSLPVTLEHAVGGQGDTLSYGQDFFAPSCNGADVVLERLERILQSLNLPQIEQSSRDINKVLFIIRWCIVRHCCVTR
jgi:hypothetical protein